MDTADEVHVEELMTQIRGEHAHALAELADLCVQRDNWVRAGLTARSIECLSNEQCATDWRVLNAWLLVTAMLVNTCDLSVVSFGSSALFLTRV
jgi:hypothetical protein